MSDMRVKWGLAALAAGLLIGQGAAIGASAEKGKTAFMKAGCWQCHGTVGQGSVATSGGKVLAPDPMPFEAFAAFVRTPSRAMPPYREAVLSNEDLGGHLRLSAVDPENDRLQDHPAAQAVDEADDRRNRRSVLRDPAPAGRSCSRRSRS